MGVGCDEEMAYTGAPGNFWGDGDAHHLDYGDGFLGMQICHNSSNYAV